jgi:hypothetical protein
LFSGSAAPATRRKAGFDVQGPAYAESHLAPWFFRRVALLQMTEIARSDFDIYRRSPLEGPLDCVTHRAFLGFEVISAGI